MGRWTIWILTLAIVIGCGDGGAAVAKRRNNLMALGIAYHEFHMLHQRSPASAAELAEHLRSSSTADEDALEALEEGDIVMNWNGNLANSAENGLYVLGFEAGAPATGGYVVMADGMVQLMTGKDFAEATMVPSAEAESQSSESP